MWSSKEDLSLLVMTSRMEGLRKGKIVFFVIQRGQEVIWPGVGQTIFLSGPLGTHAAGTSGDSEERSGSQQQQKRLTNDPNLFGDEAEAVSECNTTSIPFFTKKPFSTTNCAKYAQRLRELNYNFPLNPNNFLSTKKF